MSLVTCFLIACDLLCSSLVTCFCLMPLTHATTHLCTHAHTCSQTHPCAHTPRHPRTHAPMQLPTHPRIHRSRTQPPTHPRTSRCTYACTASTNPRVPAPPPVEQSLTQKPIFGDAEAKIRRFINQTNGAIQKLRTAIQKPSKQQPTHSGWHGFPWSCFAETFVCSCGLNAHAVEGQFAVGLMLLFLVAGFSACFRSLTLLLLRFVQVCVLYLDWTLCLIV